MLESAPPPLFAVIPTLVVAGPAALLAALCPAIFAALAFYMRRWGVLLGVASVNSTLYLAYTWFRSNADGAWWGTPQALYGALTLISFAGAILSCWRARRSEAAPAPDRLVLPGLGAASGIALGATLYGILTDQLLGWPWREGAPLAAMIWIGTVYLLNVRVLLRRTQIDRAAAFTESVMLAGLGVGCVASGLLGTRPADPPVVWTFEAADRGAIVSTPLVVGERVYVSAAHVAPLKLFGAIYCLDRTTGKRIWTFNRDGKMKQVFSSPIFDAGRLYVGEGLHEDSECGLYCLDADTGSEIWRFAAKSHVESSPRVVDGHVYFGAGDDGVYCVDAATGDLRWNFPGVHVDATAAIVGNRLYASSAYGNPQMFCLDTATGRPRWRTPSDVSVFGSPAVVDNQVFFGVGNGKLTRSFPNPAGALICLDAATGEKLWRYDVADAVLGAPAVAGDNVYFGSRDGHCYCLHRPDGSLKWKKDLASPIVAAPAISGNHLFTVTFGGALHCLDARTGAALWHFDVAKHTRTTAQLVSSPAVAVSPDDPRPQLFLGTGLHYSVNVAALVYRLKAPAGRPE